MTIQHNNKRMYLTIVADTKSETSKISTKLEAEEALELERLSAEGEDFEQHIAIISEDDGVEHVIAAHDLSDKSEASLQKFLSKAFKHSV